MSEVLRNQLAIIIRKHLVPKRAAIHELIEAAEAVAEWTPDASAGEGTAAVWDAPLITAVRVEELDGQNCPWGGSYFYVHLDDRIQAAGLVHFHDPTYRINRAGPQLGIKRKGAMCLSLDPSCLFSPERGGACPHRPPS